MIEALALLGLISMVTPVMYKKAAERTTELQDINLATQMRTLNGALDEYVRNNISSLKANGATKSATGLEVSSGEVLSFLPEGFNIDGMKYFDKDKMKFKVKQKVVDIGGVNHSTFTTAVIAPSLNPVSRTRAAKIASMIGVNGGIYDTRAAAGGNNIIGTQGAWGAKLSDWHTLGDDETLHEGTLMTISSDAITGSAPVDSSKVLYRVDDGDTQKNTMSTNLIMGSNADIEMGGNDILNFATIEGGSGDFTGDVESDGTVTGKELVATTNGAKVQEGGLKVLSGLSELLGGLDVSGGDTDINGNLNVLGDYATDLSGTLTVGGLTTLNDNLIVAGGKTTTLGGTLDVKGDTTIGEIGGTAANLTVTGTSALKGKTTIGTETAVTDVLLDVNGSANVTKDLTIGGALNAKSLHAIEKLSAGGTDYDSSAFQSSSDATSMTYGDNEFKINNSSISAKTDNVNMAVLPAAYQVDVYEDSTQATKLSSLNLNKTDAKMEYGSSSIKLDNFSAALKNDAAEISASPTTVRAIVSGTHLFYGNAGETYIASYNADNKYSKLLLKEDSAILRKMESGSVKAQLSLDDNNNFRLDANSTDMIVDDHGMAIGENLTGGSGADGSDYIRKKTASGFSYNTAEKEGGEKRAVVISRKGYIDIAPPTANFDATVADAADGHNMGFIRARRLVSDIPYVDAANFHGMDVDGSGLTADGKYDYYQVNPAYTSVMNDIKLASRGGARLSDILSDFVIKGIYVADNTYYGGTSGVSGLAKYNNGDCKGEYKHKCWDKYKIEYGSVVLHEDSGDDKVGPIECKKADCVTTPWLGYIPVPHCPKNYQMSITFSPIRWRMSEVYNLTGPGSTTKDETARYLNDSKITTTDDLIEYVTDSGTGYKFEDDGEDARFHHKFRKLTNPNDFIGVEETKAPEDGSAHDHKLTQNPVTLQTNTWLNSSVLANYKDYEGNDGNQVFGWHMIMGFLYRPGDFEKVYDGNKTLIDLLSPPDEDKSYSNDDLFFNIFPVYAQELAGIATVYCSFNRHPLKDVGPGRNNPWSAGNVGSPVIDYNQLDPALYREGYNRNPLNPKAVDENGTIIDNPNLHNGTNWNNAVNDPTLRYNDAW